MKVLKQQSRIKTKYATFTNNDRGNGFYDVAILKDMLQILGVHRSAYDWDQCVARSRQTIVESAATVAPSAATDAMPEQSQLATRGATPPCQHCPRFRRLILAQRRLIKSLRLRLQRCERKLQVVSRLPKFDKTTYQRVIRASKRLRFARNKVAAFKAEQKAASWHKGSGARYFSYHGGFHLACRRGVSNCAGYKIGLAAGVGAHHRTVHGYELRLKAALLASFRQFNCTNNAAMVEHVRTRGSGAMMSFFGVCGDATNGSVWQTCKLHCVELTSTYTLEPLMPDDTKADVLNKIETRRMLSDLHIVKDNTGEGTAGIVAKSVKSSFGVAASWAPPDGIDHHPALSTTAGRAQAIVDIGAEEERTTCLALESWLFTTDAGADELYARKIIRARAAEHAHVLIWECDCLAHQYQLIVKEGLKTLNTLATEMWKCDYTYVSTMSKFLLLWRDNARVVFQVWHDKYGPVTAREVAHKVPPQLIVGRWGSISSCEAHVLRAKQTELVAVFEIVFARLPTRTEVRKRPAAATDDHHASVEAEKEYSQRMGRWAREVLEAIHDPNCGCLLRISHMLRAPLDHFIHYLMKKRQAGEPSALASLVWYKADEIRAEIAALSNSDQWQSLLDNHIPLNCLQNAERTRTCLLMQYLADYDRRIVGACRGPLLRVLRLADAHPDGVDEGRRSICMEVLQTEKGAGHTTIFKLKDAFRFDFEHAAATGQIPKVLYHYVTLLATLWNADVQEIEGINSLVKLQCKKAPRISLAVLDARIHLTKYLGLGRRGAPTRWQAVSPKIDDAIKTACAFIEDIDAVMALPDRWSSPKPLPTPLRDHTLGINPLALEFQRAALDFAVKNSIKFVNTYRQNWLSEGRIACLTFPQDASNDDAIASGTTWLCAKVFKQTAYFYRCEFDGLRYHYDGSRAMNSIELFASKHDQCLKDGRVPPVLRDVLGEEQLAAIGYDIEPLCVIEAPPLPKRKRHKGSVPALQAPREPDDLELALDVALGFKDGDLEADDGDEHLDAQTQTDQVLKPAEGAFQDDAFNKQYDKLVQECYPDAEVGNADPVDFLVDAHVLQSLHESDQLPEDDGQHDEIAEHDGDMVHAVVEWRHAFEKSSFVMRQREEALESTPLGHNDNASLVLAYGDVEASHKKALDVTSNMLRHITYVRWKHSEQRIGQPLRPDKMNRLVWSVTAMVPWRSYQQADVIHPAIGVGAEKMVRIDIPDDIQRLHRMWGQVLKNVDEMTTPSASKCMVCKSFDDDAGGMLTCGFCLCVCHPECANSLVVSFTSSTTLPNPATFKLPDIFNADGAVCEVCKYVLLQ